MISTIDKFWIDGVCSDDFDLYCDTIILPPMAQQSVKEIKIPGREETLIEKEQEYSDIVITINTYVFDNHYNVNELYGRLSTAKNLVTTQNPAWRFSVKKLLAITPNYSGKGKTHIAISFQCSPFRYKIGREDAQQISQNDTEIINESNIFSRPELVVAGSGDISLSLRIDGKYTTPLEIFNVSGIATVDAVLMLVYNHSKSIYSTRGNFFFLPPGESTLHWEGNISEITVFKNTRWL